MRLSFHIKVSLQKSDYWFVQGESKCIKKILIFQAKYFECYENFMILMENNIYSKRNWQILFDFWVYSKQWKLAIWAVAVMGIRIILAFRIRVEKKSDKSYKNRQKSPDFVFFSIIGRIRIRIKLKNNCNYCTGCQHFVNGDRRCEIGGFRRFRSNHRHTWQTKIFHR